MSSSQPRPLPAEAIVRRDDKSIGPIRLPEKPTTFVQTFNRIYGEKGLTIQPVQTTPDQLTDPPS
jgi:hypothetical protein